MWDTYHAYGPHFCSAKILLFVYFTLKQTNQIKLNKYLEASGLWAGPGILVKFSTAWAHSNFLTVKFFIFYFIDSKSHIYILEGNLVMIGPHRKSYVSQICVLLIRRYLYFVCGSACVTLKHRWRSFCHASNFMSFKSSFLTAWVPLALSKKGSHRTGSRFQSRIRSTEFRVIKSNDGDASITRLMMRLGI